MAERRALEKRRLAKRRLVSLKTDSNLGVSDVRDSWEVGSFTS